MTRFDRISYRYRLDYALAHGRPAPEPATDEERRIRDQRLRRKAEAVERAAAKHRRAMARPVVALDVEWTGAALTEVTGRCSHPDLAGPVYLNRKRRGQVLLSFAGVVAVLDGRPWTLDGAPMPGPLRTVTVPASPRYPGAEATGRRPGLARILVGDVPGEVPGVFDAFGIVPLDLQRRWSGMAPGPRIEEKAAWVRAWAERHGRAHPSESVQSAPAPSAAAPEPSRDERIDAAVRTYTGPRTKRGWPYLRPLRRHAGIPDLDAADRARVCRRIESAESGQPAPSPTESESSRDARIDAAVRSYAGPRTKRGWPYLRPLRRHAGIPDLDAADRARVCRRIESGGFSIRGGRLIRGPS